MNNTIYSGVRQEYHDQQERRGEGMTGKTEMERRREEHRRLALLGLAGSKIEPGGECPAESELAALLDGRCSRPRQRQLQEHLASCPGCYQRWLEAAELLAESTGAAGNRRNGRSFWSRSKILAATGSICAAAAAVALFWTTLFYQQQAVHRQPSPMATPAEIITDSKAHSPAFEAESSRREAAREPAAAAGKADQADGLQQEEDRPPGPSRKQGLTAAPEREPSMGAETAAEVSLERFLQSAAALCGPEAAAPAERREVFRQGRKLAATGSLSAAQRRILAQLLELLDDRDPDREWCSRLERLVQEATQNLNGSRVEKPALQGLE